MAKATSLKAVLTKYFEPKTPSSYDLGPFATKTVSVKDAKDLASVMEMIDLEALESNTEFIEIANKLSTLTDFFQRVQKPAVVDVMLTQVLPELMRIYDQWITMPSCDESTALSIVNVFGFTRTMEGTVRVIQATRLFPDGFNWVYILNGYADEHSLVGDLLAGLSDPLPQGFCRIAFLDLCNSLAKSKQITEHPFDSAEGRKQLKAWLQSTKPEDFSYAGSATTALAFLAPRGREELLSLASNHQNKTIQLEAAATKARLGDRDGVKYLMRMCMDVHYTLAAQEQLRELELGERIPDAIYSPDFFSAAQMSNWLQHPSEFGEVPDELDLFDKRTLYWPPTKDTRTVWLFRYQYGKGKKANVGIGMVGSITFALFGETTPDMSPEDIYALHCCWELEANEDPRAPKKRSIAAGRKLLGMGRKR